MALAVLHFTSDSLPALHASAVIASITHCIALMLGQLKSVYSMIE